MIVHPDLRPVPLTFGSGASQSNRSGPITRGLLPAPLSHSAPGRPWLPPQASPAFAAWAPAAAAMLDALAAPSSPTTGDPR